MYKTKVKIVAKTRTREKIIEFLQSNYPKDYNVNEIAEALGIHRHTIGTYVKALVAEGKIVLSRTIGSATMYSVPKEDL